MSEFNLKKKNARRDAYFDKSNFLSKNGSRLINNNLNYMSKKFEKCLILDQNLIINMKKFNYSEVSDINTMSTVEEKFDSVLSNFDLQIPLSINSKNVLDKIILKLNKNGLFCFNTITINSMKTLQNIFIEIDEKIYGGAYRRFGPFLDTSKLIEDLRISNFKDVVVGMDTLEINYSTFDMLRSDFRKFGISNYFNKDYIFKKEFLKLTNKIFSKIIDNHQYIPLELEIATFTSWK